ncbi:MAG: hypothetical protein LBM04_11110 [Opitutaceae bacterium]|jgi:hypothetical protein|nr:hypothetical protein [Opitutaceae bacterium]
MILPTKRMAVETSLLGVGADVLGLLGRPKTISRLWDDVKSLRETRSPASTPGYDWFVLALDMLYALGAIEFDDGEVRKAKP